MAHLLLQGVTINGVSAICNMSTTSRSISRNGKGPFQPGESRINTSSTIRSCTNIAVQNKMVEDPPLTLWDIWPHYWTKFLEIFDNWNNRQVPKTIAINSTVLDTYNESILFGKLSTSARGRSFVKTPIIDVT